MGPLVLRSVLVANRGEIALRVLRTCARLGIRTVAIHTGLDAAAPHVRAADQAVEVASYLDIEAVVAAAVAAGVDAVHPGYGFLSERAEFAEAVAAAGLVFVGPPPEAMRLMGRKDAARELAVAAGVPVVPQGEDAAYPVLVKAAAGGGGKGMRIVRAEGELAEARAAAAREAKAAFGDDTLLVEKYVERGRHVEVQVLADAHGQVIHLFERDCSTQRRHQKVIEEAPSPVVDAGLRHRMTSAAVGLAQRVGYVNAGTVEFLLDTDTGEFYFLEMNTRLQVEHPVTEAICGGLDLVEAQLRIAAGEPLDLGQQDLGIHGHAIEARVYAEDAYAGFLPQAGTATTVRWPTGARVDHALESGQVVSTAYDPMLGKIIVHAPDREAARRALVTALDETAVLGLTTNVGFLRQLVASEEFAAAEIDTAWLDRHELAAPDPEAARVLAAWASARASATGAGGPFAADGWRLGAAPAPVLVELDRVLPVLVDAGGGGSVSGGTVGGVSVEELEHRARPDGTFELVVALDGERHRAVGRVGVHDVEVVHRGQRFSFARPDAFADHAVHAGDGIVVAPMPGTVLAVVVAEGELVAEGQTLGMMEAMKMELALRAPFAGRVTAVEATTGAQVALRARLFVVEPPADPGERHTVGS